ncbi:MAG: SRPBCC family protein, partial [Bacillota bacterium]
MKKRHRHFFAIALLFSALQAMAATAPDDDITVDVRKSGDRVLVDVSMSVQAPPRDAWDVLTDYDHMAQFFPNLVSSKIVERSGGRVRVEQKGNVSYGPLTFPFESVRDIELTQDSEIRSHAVAGTLKAGDATTR